MTSKYGTPFFGVTAKTKISEGRNLNIGDKIIVEGVMKSQDYTIFTPKTEKQYLDDLRQDAEKDGEFKVNYAEVTVHRFTEWIEKGREVGDYCITRYEVFTKVHATVLDASPVAPIVIGLIIVGVLGIIVAIGVFTMTYYLVETAKEIVEDLEEDIDKFLGDILKLPEGIGGIAGGFILLGIVLLILVVGSIILYTGVKKI